MNLNASSSFIISQFATSDKSLSNSRLLLHKWKSRWLLLLLRHSRHLIHEVERWLCLWLWLLLLLLIQAKTLIRGLWLLHKTKRTAALSTKRLIHWMLMRLLEVSLIHHSTHNILKSSSKLVLLRCWNWGVWHTHHWLIPNHIQIFTFCM